MSHKKLFSLEEFQAQSQSALPVELEVLTDNSQEIEEIIVDQIEQESHEEVALETIFLRKRQIDKLLALDANMSNEAREFIVQSLNDTYNSIGMRGSDSLEGHLALGVKLEDSLEANIFKQMGRAFSYQLDNIFVALSNLFRENITKAKNYQKQMMELERDFRRLSDDDYKVHFNTIWMHLSNENEPETNFVGVTKQDFEISSYILDTYVKDLMKAIELLTRANQSARIKDSKDAIRYLQSIEKITDPTLNFPKRYMRGYYLYGYKRLELHEGNRRKVIVIDNVQLRELADQATSHILKEKTNGKFIAAKTAMVGGTLAVGSLAILVDIGIHRNAVNLSSSDIQELMDLTTSYTKNIEKYVDRVRVVPALVRKLEESFQKVQEQFMELEGDNSSELKAALKQAQSYGKNLVKATSTVQIAESKRTLTTVAYLIIAIQRALSGAD